MDLHENGDKEFYSLLMEISEIEEEFIKNNIPQLGSVTFYNNELYNVAYTNINRVDDLGQKVILANFMEKDSNLRKVVLTFKEYIEHVYNMKKLIEEIEKKEGKITLKKYFL